MYRGCRRPFLPVWFDPPEDLHTVSTDFSSIASLSRVDLDAGRKLRYFRSHPSLQKVVVCLDPWGRGTFNLAEHHTFEKNKRTHRVTVLSPGNSPKLYRPVFRHHRVGVWLAKSGRLPKYLGASVGRGPSTFRLGPKCHRLGLGALVVLVDPPTKRPQPRWWV